MPKFLITGGNRSLGYHTAAFLLQFPDHQVFIGSRSLEKGHEAADRLNNSPKTHSSSIASAVQIDVKDDESIRKCSGLPDLQTLDVLVNNAGVIEAIPSDKSKVRQTMRDLYEINVFGVAAVTEAFLPSLRRSKQRPVIVNVGSELGSVGDRLDPNSSFRMADIIAYSSGKSALNGITAHYAIHEPEIRVVVVTPGESDRSIAYQQQTASFKESEKEILEVFDS